MDGIFGWLGDHAAHQELIKSMGRATRPSSEDLLREHSSPVLGVAACSRFGKATTHVEEGLATLDEREAVAEKTGERGFDAECFRLRGGFLLLAGDEAAAEHNMRAAIEHARGKQAKGYELRAAIDLARLLVSRGQRAEGREVLAPVFEWFTEGFDTYDLVAAKALLTDIG